MENSNLIKNQIKELIKNSSNEIFSSDKALCNFLKKHQFNVINKEKFKDFLKALYFLNVFHQNNHSQPLFAIIEQGGEKYLVSHLEMIGTFTLEVYPFKNLLQAMEARQELLNFAKNFLNH